MNTTVPTARRIVIESYILFPNIYATMPPKKKDTTEAIRICVAGCPNTIVPLM